MCGNLYLSKRITKESKVADTRGSAATAFKFQVSTIGFYTSPPSHLLSSLPLISSEKPIFVMAVSLQGPHYMYLFSILLV
jgi:hypothetical protein